mmetsp:Transcript_22009/g.54402  ORF Transcript_22009/g.54402 Transcript_22009/m.54402 type:complete len:125 (+) Transcript_22009:301-675(+)|eukprot:CAMPEP_0184733322 /NCGR_PEP_ID=MMETSP0314-20130426/57003_1 /TAXON_ID=38298 /ORGANISM="Rhodella maculata, Strain CCMP 736" /LENGTH=124 /DNA_ID=CAMNT_0027200113 /DNA_START=297 /DNA_END=671 /DNA_ORIENTATION=-
MSSIEKNCTTTSSTLSQVYEKAAETASSVGDAIKCSLGLKNEHTSAEKLADSAGDTKDAAVEGAGEAANALSEEFNGAGEAAPLDGSKQTDNAAGAVKTGAETAAKRVGNAAEGASEAWKGALG